METRFVSFVSFVKATQETRFLRALCRRFTKNIFRFSSPDMIPCRVVFSEMKRVRSSDNCLALMARMFDVRVRVAEVLAVVTGRVQSRAVELLHEITKEVRKAEEKISGNELTPHELPIAYPLVSDHGDSKPLAISDHLAIGQKLKGVMLALAELGTDSSKAFGKTSKIYSHIYMASRKNVQVRAILEMTLKQTFPSVRNATAYYFGDRSPDAANEPPSVLAAGLAG